MDYKKLGFKAGLEIHQQLATHKLFCKCPSEFQEKHTYSFKRFLHPTQSELGEVDIAAMEEARRKRKFIYHASASSCLVEADEEPPHEANKEAIDIALIISLLLKADIVDEIHFMRKIVVDGSNTTGFQRTALIAMNGEVDGIEIKTICLEEDAARKVKEREKEVEYSLDRLGIPLVEIVTAPSIPNPMKAKEIAEKIGMILRATKKVRRGIGTIRQDLNVSIKEGNRVEIKGVQELNDIPKILENEVRRQIELIEVAKELRKRIDEKSLKKIEIKDVSHVFKNTKSKLIKKAMEKGVVMAIKLKGFKGLLAGMKYKEHRIGKEFAMHAKIEGGGIIHSDELPNYGISIDEVEKIKKELKCSDKDAFIISAGKENTAKKSLEAVIRRARQSFYVPKEVRRALPDCTTEYMRPMPTAARMYPETDVPPIRITEKKLKEIRKMLPELPDKKIERITKEYRISKEIAKQLVYSGKDEIFEKMAKKYKNMENMIIRILINIMTEMEKEGYAPKMLEDRMEDVLEGLKNKMFAKEGIERILRYFMKNPTASLQEAIEKCELRQMSMEEIRRIIEKIVKEKIEFIKERKERAISPLMGLAMKKLRGKVDGAIVNKILKGEIEKILAIQ